MIVSENDKDLTSGLLLWLVINWQWQALYWPSGNQPENDFTSKGSIAFKKSLLGRLHLALVEISE